MIDDKNGVMREWYENDRDVVPTYIDDNDFEDNLRGRILEYLNVRKIINQMKERTPSSHGKVVAENKWRTNALPETYPFFHGIPKNKKANRPMYLSGQNGVSDIIRL